MNHSEAQSLALELMNQHGVSHWTFRFDRALRRFGYCRYQPKVISLSYELVGANDVVEVKDVILHEIAHAIVGPGNGHNYVWRQAARRIGARGTRCYPEHVQGVQKKWIGNCPNCGKVFYCHRRRRISCGRCSKIWNPAYLIPWRPNVAPVSLYKSENHVEQIV